MSEDLRKDVTACFGIVDSVFAGHPMDEQRAKELRTKIKRGVYSWDDVEFTIHGVLAKRGCTPEHIDAQVKKAAKFFGTTA